VGKNCAARMRSGRRIVPIEALLKLADRVAMDMGGDDSQKLLPWRGALLSGAQQTSGVR
jgi:hypothetical protein